MKKALIILSVIIVSCNADDVHRTFQPISGEAKYYMDFDPGSYWVYEDSISGNIDSVVLLSKKLKLNGSGEDLYYGHSIVYVFYSSLFDQYFNAELLYYTDSTYTAFKRDIDYTMIFIVDHLIVGTRVGYDTFQLKGKEYYRVKGFFIEDWQHSYVAKNIGLIKIYKNYSDETKQCWELIRYNVVRN